MPSVPAAAVAGTETVSGPDKVLVPFVHVHVPFALGPVHVARAELAATMGSSKAAAGIKASAKYTFLLF
jgi:hypothetical protein